MFRTDSGSFHDVWSLAELDEFLAGSPRRPLVRLVEEGQALAPDRYTSTKRLGGTDFSDAIDPSKVADRFCDGATVVAQSLHRTHPSVRRFAALLTDEVSHPVQANAYLTPPRSRGLAPHSDRHDVFVVQVHGVKRWTVDGLGEVELTDGDVLYLPAGTRHHATSTDTSSLHLTVGILRVTYRAVLQRLLRDAPDTLDGPLPLRYRDADVDIADAIAERIDAVVAHLVAVDPADVAALERGRDRQRLASGARLRQAVDVLGLDGTERLRCTDGWVVSTGDDGRIRVSDDRHRLEAPDTCDPAIRRLEIGDDCTIGDLPGLDDDSRIVLARRLLAVGLCEFASPPPRA